MSAIFDNLSVGMESISDLLGSSGDLSTSNPLKDSFESLRSGDSTGFSNGDSITLSREEFETMASLYEFGQEEREFMISEEKRQKGFKLSRDDRKKAKKLLKETMKSEKSFAAVLATLAEQAEKTRDEQNRPEKSEEAVLAASSAVLIYLLFLVVGIGFGVLINYLAVCLETKQFDKKYLEKERDLSWKTAERYKDSDNQKSRRLAKRLQRWGDFLDKRIKKGKFKVDIEGAERKFDEATAGGEE